MEIYEKPVKNPVVPSLTIVESKGETALVVFPGGGYWMHADHEAEIVAERFSQSGVAGYVLRYRKQPADRHPHPWADAQEAILWARNRGHRKVGVLGFSAGGHLAATAATRNGGLDDPARPDFAVLIYPVISMVEACRHQGSTDALLGADAPLALREELSAERRVDSQTPPLFLVHAEDDLAVPLANSLLLVAACEKAGVPHELHVYPKGGHGFGLGSDDQNRDWPRKASDWIQRL
jgi:acetyl esterase/lipase